MFINICIVLQNIKVSKSDVAKICFPGTVHLLSPSEICCKLSVRPYLYCIHTLFYNKVYFFVAFAIFCSVMEKIVMFDVRFEIQKFSIKRAMHSYYKRLSTSKHI